MRTPGRRPGSATGRRHRSSWAACSPAGRCARRQDGYTCSVTMRVACACNSERCALAEPFDVLNALCERGHERILRRRHVAEGAHLRERRLHDETRRKHLLRDQLLGFADRFVHARADLLHARDVVRRILGFHQRMTQRQRFHQADVGAVELIQRKVVVEKGFAMRRCARAATASARRTRAAIRSSCCDRTSAARPGRVSLA